MAETDATPEALHATYQTARRRMVDLVRSLTAEQLAAPVTACPEWTVKDLVAHLTGVCHDLPNGNTPPGGAASRDWTAAQVDTRRDKSLDELLEEWDGHAVDLAGKIGTMGFMAKIIAADLTAHEFDVRTAVGRRDGRDVADVRELLDLFAGGLDARIKRDGLPALRMVADGDERILGEGEPGATVRASTFELMRAVGGRRTPDEIRAYDWDGDPGPYVERFAVFPFPESSIGE